MTSVTLDSVFIVLFFIVVAVVFVLVIAVVVVLGFCLVLFPFSMRGDNVTQTKTVNDKMRTVGYFSKSSNKTKKTSKNCHNRCKDLLFPCTLKENNNYSQMQFYITIAFFEGPCFGQKKIVYC